MRFLPLVTIFGKYISSYFKSCHVQNISLSPILAKSEHGPPFNGQQLPASTVFLHERDLSDEKS